MKRSLVLILALAALAALAVFLIFQSPLPPPDAVYVNDAVMRALQSDDSATATQDLLQDINIAFAEADSARQSRDNAIKVFLYSFVFALAAAAVLLHLYYDRRVLTPFRNMEKMARRIASGDLDIPLEMDRANAFGAFTESFDILREELRTAKENEYQADKSKKELVASLSHDIKTPVASIRATAELMSAQSSCAREKQQLHTINLKAQQIDELITDMFHATLEELQALRVETLELESAEIKKLILDADYAKKIQAFSIPDAVLLADPLRLQQVLNNVLSNSYKYADTDIIANAFFEEEYLTIELRDFGSRAVPEEEALLCNKFFRGTNAEGQDGYGLGLFISKYLMEEMSGSLKPTILLDGFLVKISLRLAS